MPWGDEALRFLNKTLLWPASANDAGHGNIHWTNKNPRPGGKPLWIGKGFKSAAELVSFAGWLITKPNVLDIYYCTSLQAQTAVSKSGKVIALRSLPNTLSSRVLFLDIDVKPPPKGYTDTNDALLALGDFLKEFKFPFPHAIVASGGGLHVYWIGETSRPHAEWQPRAERLRSAAVNFGLRCDGQCTVDITRILRLPETLNWKTDPPRPVKLLHLE